MTEVTAQVWYWTPAGMSQNTVAFSEPTQYVEKREAERLLEEAHRRGYERGTQDTSALT